MPVADGAPGDHTVLAAVATPDVWWLGCRVGHTLRYKFLGEQFEMLPDFERGGRARRATAVWQHATSLAEDRREFDTLTSLEALWLDLRHALRVLWKGRAFAAVSIATLGLGIGAATAIFSVIDNVLLSPFPYKDAGHMVFPRILSPQESEGEGWQSYTALEAREFAENNHVFDRTMANAEESFLLKHGEGREEFYGVRVTPGTFEFFGMPALHGRALEQGDYEPGAPPVFVMRYKTWKTRFNGDLSILNQTFVLNGTARTLIGIMPPRFGWFEAEVLIPEKLTEEAVAGSTDSPDWFFLGHLKPGVSVRQAEADLTIIANRLAKIVIETSVLLLSKEETAQFRREDARVELRSWAHFSLSRESQHAADHTGNPLPVLGFHRELLLAAPGDRIELRLAVVLRRSPLGGNPSPSLHAQQRGVDRTLIELENVAAHLLDAPRNSEPM